MLMEREDTTATADTFGWWRVLRGAWKGWWLAVAIVAGPALGAGLSIARVWDERALAAIRVDSPNPPAQARNLFSLATCMYDVWAAYDTNAVGFIYHTKHTAVDVAAARREAISYAAYRILKERHFYSRTDFDTLIADDGLMTSLGYDTNNISRDLSTPAGVGNSVYDAVSTWFINDGSRQTNGTQSIPYPDYPVASGGYIYINKALAADRHGIDDGFGNGIVDVNHWQRLQVTNGLDQKGFPVRPIQNYQGAQWLGVRPFALVRTDRTRPWIDPGPPPAWGGDSTAEFITNVVSVLRASSELTPDDGVVFDISPASFGNNSLNGIDGHGYPLNPATGLPYPPNPTKRGDFTRVLAEFWADGPNSETPPGHWNVILNDVSDHPLMVKKIGGVGAVVDDLEWDVKAYFAVNAALHDAACAAWSLKRYYDGWRPLSAIRYLGGLGQSTDPTMSSYHKLGLPLITNLIELVTPGSIASGRHKGLRAGKIAVLSWPGQPADPANTYQGVRWIGVEDWLPYQKTSFVTPAFPGYVSGHSSFSRAAAEVLTAFTGSAYFPGGLGSYTISSLSFEKGPTQPVELQYATYFDAADLAGLSRIWGGIHPPVDNLVGRRVGAEAGRRAWAMARQYFDGSILQTPSQVAIAPTTAGSEIRYETLRGFYYQLEATTDLKQPFADAGGGWVRAENSSVQAVQSAGAGSKFFRLRRESKP